jgi:hypothetical protein
MYEHKNQVKTDCQCSWKCNVDEEVCLVKSNEREITYFMNLSRQRHIMTTYYDISIVFSELKYREFLLFLMGNNEVRDVQESTYLEEDSKC